MSEKAYKRQPAGSKQNRRVLFIYNNYYYLPK